VFQIVDSVMLLCYALAQHAVRVLGTEGAGSIIVTLNSALDDERNKTVELITVA